ncbi:MAG: hypothetical protein IJC56_02290 [Clostridia bacterium]|nr:hypothetical protein [Clostridia bacterium]
MITIIESLRKNPQVTDYKIETVKKESCELFYVNGKLETVRSTDTCDKEVTVYVDHDGCKGDSQFFVYPSTTPDQLDALVAEAVNKALIISNKPYELPAAEQAEYVVASNFSDYKPADLAAEVADAVFSANTIENATLNSVEVFINKYTETVVNSRGLNKTQTRYDAMIEAIPTFNGETQSVEIYEQHNFSEFSKAAITAEIANKMAEVKARYEAVTPDPKPQCKVVLNSFEMMSLFMRIAFSLNYSAVYSKSNLFSKGDKIQKNPEGDLITITMAGEVKGNSRSSKFDADGLSLGSIRIVENGEVTNYFGSNRFGQYLGETPSGDMHCICVEPGSVDAIEGPYFEVLQTSGLQVDFYNDYIGGEVRLAYYHDGEKIIPVTGVAISGKLSQVLDHIRFTSYTADRSGYTGPAKAILTDMNIF